jgi:hypothetical protein
LNEPTEENSFTIQRTPTPPELTGIIDELNSSNVDYPVAQAAVWIMTDNATFDELGLLVEGSRFGDSIINEDETVQAMLLITEAGVSIRAYAIWEDSMQLVGNVTSPDLSTWLYDQVATQAVEEATQMAQEVTKVGVKGTPETQATPALNADEISQYATSATASSQYSEPGWSAMQATGAPDTLTCNDSPTAWASQSPADRDWLLLTYDQAVIPTRIVIFEIYHPGAISQVEVLDESGNPITVFVAATTIVDQCPRFLEIDTSSVNVPVRQVRVTVDQTSHNGWDEIDAVQLFGKPSAGNGASFPFALTVAKYPETGDLGSACSLEFGSTWQIADWMDVIEYSQAGNSAEVIVSTLALTANNPYWVTYNEQGWFSAQRHYFLEFHNHILPGGFLAHEEIDNHYLDLGSWYGLQVPVLCHNH